MPLLLFLIKHLLTVLLLARIKFPELKLLNADLLLAGSFKPPSTILLQSTMAQQVTQRII
jgi:hypothetical protein